MECGWDRADAERGRREHQILAGGEDRVGPPGWLREGEDDGRNLADGVCQRRGRPIAFLLRRNVAAARPAALFVVALGPPRLVVESAERKNFWSIGDDQETPWLAVAAARD